MAKFRITSSREADRYPPSTYFDIEWISGRLEAGQRIVLFDTRHQCNFDVLEIEDRGDTATVKASGLIPWDDQWRGAIVDTDDPMAARWYGYGVPNEPGKEDH